MNDIKTKVLNIETNDEHLAIRLGAALALNWETLSSDIKQNILNSAVHSPYPKQETVQLAQQLQTFIDQYKK